LVAVAAARDGGGASEVKKAGRILVLEAPARKKASRIWVDRE
jgi:hypothetical protein